MQSSHGLRDGRFTVRSARHTALLHLKPEPKAICHTRSPRFTRSLASMYASSYHKELLDVLPNLLGIREFGHWRWIQLTHVALFYDGFMMICEQMFYLLLCNELEAMADTGWLTCGESFARAPCAIP